MKRLLLAIAALAGACASAPAQQPAPGTAIQLGVTYRLESQVLGERREINVWTPPGYAAGDARYTVLYLIDGGVDQDFPHIAGLGQLGAVSGTYEELIVVGVRTNTRIHELTPAPADSRYTRAFPQAGGSEQFRRYLREDVIPFIEARYRTGARRGVIGESLAGLFVVDTYLDEPALFDDYIAVSPSLWWDDRTLARRAAELFAAQEASGRRMYLSIAQEDGTMRDGVDTARAALASAPEKLAFRFADRTGETHATTFHPAALDALRWLYATAPIDYGPRPWWMTEGAAPPQENSQ
ncbi:MAG: alpha/beta hydrolase [Vitreimonas sp.]